MKSLACEWGLHCQDRGIQLASIVDKVWNLFNKIAPLLSKEGRVCDSVMLEILMDHKFQLPQEGLNCKPLTCNAVT